MFYAIENRNEGKQNGEHVMQHMTRSISFRWWKKGNTKTRWIEWKCSEAHLQWFSDGKEMEIHSIQWLAIFLFVWLCSLDPEVIIISRILMTFANVIFHFCENWNENKEWTKAKEEKKMEFFNFRKKKKKRRFQVNSIFFVPSFYGFGTFAVLIQIEFSVVEEKNTFKR